MAFISLLAAMAFVIFLAVAILVAGLLAVIIGTVLIHKTKYRKTGITLRIIGYVILVPAVVVIIMFIAAMVSGG